MLAEKCFSRVVDAEIEHIVAVNSAKIHITEVRVQPLQQLWIELHVIHPERVIKDNICIIWCVHLFNIWSCAI